MRRPLLVAGMAAAVAVPSTATAAPLPPDGPGMECSNMRTYGYAQVEATATSLKVVLKDTKGQQMRNASDGKPCGPWALAAR